MMYYLKTGPSFPTKNYARTVVRLDMTTGITEFVYFVEEGTPDLLMRCNKHDHDPAWRVKSKNMETKE